MRVGGSGFSISIFRGYTVQSTTYGPSMNRTYLSVWSAKLTPTLDVAGKQIAQLYELTVLFRKDGQPHRVWQIHVPNTLRSLLDSGSVRGIVIETLESGSVASWLLPHSPTHIMLALTNASGELHSATPSVLVRMRWAALAVGYAVVLGGMAALTSCALHVWIGAAACVLGSHCVRTALRIPTGAESDVY